MSSSSKQAATDVRVGLIGLGVMGLPMAKNIARAGMDLTVFNRSPGPLAEFKGTKVKTAGSAADVFKAADAIVLMLKDGAATDAVLGHTGADFEVVVGDKLVINAATLTPRYSESLGRAIENAGGIYVEAPVSGSQGPAESGDLLVMTAGPEDAVARAKPIFDAIGKSQVYCGPAPAAMRMKCASNALLAGLMSGLAESFNFAREIGLDLELYSKVILDGPLANDFLRMKMPRLIAEDYSPQAALHNVAYSLDILLDEAERAEIPIDGARLMRNRSVAAIDEGYADEDVLAVIKILQAAGGKK